MSENEKSYRAWLNKPYEKVLALNDVVRQVEEVQKKDNKKYPLFTGKFQDEKGEKDIGKVTVFLNLTSKNTPFLNVVLKTEEDDEDLI